MHSSRSGEAGQHELLEIVEQVSSSFGFTPISVHRMSHPNTFIVDIVERSALTERLFIKYSAVDESHQVELCHSLQAAQLGVAPRFRRSRDGQSCIRLADRFWTCQSYIPADVQFDWLAFDCSNVHTGKAGEMLGQLHAKSSFIAEELLNSGKAKTVSSMIENEVTLLQECFNRLEKTMEKVWSDSPADGLDAESDEREAPIAAIKAIEAILKVKDPILARAEKLCAFLLDAEGDADPVVNHGDYHCSNIIYSSAGIKLVCDWEYACIGSSLYDLSYALFLFCFDYPKKSGDPPLNPKRIEYFLDGYNRANRLNAEKMMLLDSYMEYAQLLIMRWLLNEFVQPKSFHESMSRFWRFFVEFLSQCSKTGPKGNPA